MHVVVVCLFISCLISLLTIASIDAHFRENSRFRGSRLLAFFELSAAWCLGLIFLTGGVGKLIPFPGIMGPVHMEEVMEPYGLGMFARFIAWSELLIGLALLSKQTRALGAIMMVPLLLNILMVTISMNWTGTPWVILIFLSANVFLLAFHFDRWRPLVEMGFERIAFKTRAFVGYGQIVWAVSLSTIAFAPFLYAFNPYFCAAAVSSAFLGLFCCDIASKFQPGN